MLRTNNLELKAPEFISIFFVMFNAALCFLVSLDFNITNSTVIFVQVILFILFTYYSKIWLANIKSLLILGLLLIMWFVSFMQKDANLKTIFDLLIIPISIYVASAYSGDDEHRFWWEREHLDILASS